jgi:hypothetical protein
MAIVWTFAKKIPQSAAFRDSLIAFGAGRIYYTLIGLLIWWTKYRPPEADFYYWGIQPVLNGPAGALLGVWQRWDGIHYQRIAAFGYTNDHLSMFYPLYPLLSRWLAGFTHLDLLLSLILVSNTAFFVSMVLLHNLISQHFSEQIARMTLVWVILFPSGVYDYAIYPQSLLLLLILLTALLISRGWWAGALLSGFLAGLTHSTSVVLSFLVGIEALRTLLPQIAAVRQKRFIFSWNYLFALLAPFATPLGIASFMLWRSQAGFPPYAELQQASYSRVLTMPWDGVAEIVKFILSPPPTVNIFAAWINFAVFALMVLLTVVSFRRIPWSWWLMQTGFLIFITTNLTVGNPMICFSRFALIIFPMFLEFSILIRQSRWRLVNFAIGIFLSFVYSAMFFMWLYDLA